MYSISPYEGNINVQTLAHLTRLIILHKVKIHMWRQSIAKQ